MTTNHRTANEFSNTTYALHHKGSYRDGVYDGAIEMATFKDNLFKTELNKLRNRFIGEESHKAYFSLQTLNELYNTLFPND